MSSAIELCNISKIFQNKRVLDGLSMSIQKGESAVILGGSGSGKSVTIKCMLGLIEPDSGEVFLGGKSRFSMSRAQRADFLDEFGMLFQNSALFDSMHVWENVSFRFLCGKRKMSSRRCRDLAIEKLHCVGLEAETADLYPAELSGGMQKRVGIARAIAADPSILFFDEPTAGLDPLMAAVINRLIRKIVEKSRVTAVTITHDMETVRTVSDKVYVLKDGNIHWEGKTLEIENSGNDYVERFIHGHVEE